MGNIQDQNLIDAIARGDEMTVKIYGSGKPILTIGAWNTCEHPDKEFAVNFVNTLADSARARIVNEQNKAYAAKQAQVHEPKANHFVLSSIAKLPKLLDTSVPYEIEFASVGECRVKNMEETIFAGEHVTFRVINVEQTFKDYFKAQIIVFGSPGQRYDRSVFIPGMLFIEWKP